MQIQNAKLSTIKLLPEHSNTSRALLFEIIEHTLCIENQEQFIRWTRNELQRIFPHVGLICGMGRFGKDGVHVSHLMAYNFPQEYLQTLQCGKGLLESPLLRLWTKQQQPILFDADSDLFERLIDSAWLKNFRHFGLNNLAVHGQSEIDRQSGSYFSFSGLPGPLTSHHAYLLKLLVPYMHITLIRIVSSQGEKENSSCLQFSGLTTRENEILKWMETGKTNWEIAQVLKISEATVKNHVHHILVRLDVCTRTQAVAKAMGKAQLHHRLTLVLCANIGILMQGMDLLIGDCGGLC